MTTNKNDLHPDQASPPQSRDPLARIRQLERNALAKATERAEEAVAISTPPDVHVTDDIKPMTPRRDKVRGRSSATLVESAQLSLIADLEGRAVTSEGVGIKSGYPTLLSRIPIFIPSKRKNQKAITDEKGAVQFKGSWGTGYKYGPPLTIYHEDTLMALGRLRQYKLTGSLRRMPIPVSDVFKKSGGGEGMTHALHCMVADIQRMCGTSMNGTSNRRRLDAIRDLANVRIEFVTASSRFVQAGTSIHLIDICWQQFIEEAILYAQFTPIMAQWFDADYTCIDWDVRAQLPDVGKAIHRFLSSQLSSKESYPVPLKEMYKAIGYQRAYKAFLYDLRQNLEHMKNLNWLSSWKLEGNGRSIPHKLIVVKRKTKSISIV